ncbi:MULTISPECIES: hypothetical protein [unclassified Paenibacillus]|uniref:hypothetical protein n=1 Tax=unclassified Paenibacillus TaxID=185978 RepID=UPI0007BEFC89|nr:MULTISPECIES: hypothetical protein [unclassified Paenibacillus]PIH59107.1 hypothetical protein CS562_14300 [Paenibacillus sp. LK1]
MKNTLNIDKKSIGLITIANFFFQDYRNNEEFVRQCSGMNGKQINSWLMQYRFQKISETRYRSQNEFVEAYNVNPPMALERLFQERINSDKLSKLNCIDPITIYTYHIKDPNVKFNSFTGYFL